MFRRFIGWLFGFTRELNEMRQRASELEWDTAFGMYTRPALMAMSKTQLKGRKSVVFLDLCGKAQSIRAERSKKSNSFRKGSKVGNYAGTKYLLSTFIKCECGRNMQVSRSRGGRIYYVCPARTKDGTCDNESRPERSQIESDVMELIRKEILGEEGMRFLEREV
ncbi:unnamed protein product, partial [marine sediment metagenome]